MLKKSDTTNEIAVARIAAGLTQQQMSDLLKIPKRTIENWENDKRQPPEYVKRLVIEKLQKIKDCPPLPFYL